MAQAVRDLAASHPSVEQAAGAINTLSAGRAEQRRITAVLARLASAQQIEARPQSPDTS